VGLLYDSGVQVYIHTAAFKDPQAFYESMLAEGDEGTIETILGVPAFVAPQQTKDGPASVDLVLNGVEVAIVGEFPVTDIKRIAATLS
jgi:hypothetical protein